MLTILLFNKNNMWKTIKFISLLSIFIIIWCWEEKYYEDLPQEKQIEIQSFMQQIDKQKLFNEYLAELQKKFKQDMNKYLSDWKIENITKEQKEALISDNQEQIEKLFTHDELKKVMKEIQSIFSVNNYELEKSAILNDKMKEKLIKEYPNINFDQLLIDWI